MFCIAVPNPLTAPLDLSAADMRLTSLAELPLAEALRTALGARDSSGASGTGGILPAPARSAGP